MSGVTHIYMVRHGQAAAGWDSAADPELSAAGRAQAAALAGDLAAALEPAPIMSSPLRRCRETAAPLAALWGKEVAIEPRIAEIPAPEADLTARGAWLRRVMAGSWAELEAEQGHDYARWRRDVAAALLAQRAPVVVLFSHFIAINAACAAARAAAQMISQRPNYCSITHFTSDGARLTLVDAPSSAATKVL